MYWFFVFCFQNAAVRGFPGTSSLFFPHSFQGDTRQVTSHRSQSGTRSGGQCLPGNHEIGGRKSLRQHGLPQRGWLWWRLNACLLVGEQKGNRLLVLWEGRLTQVVPGTISNSRWNAPSYLFLLVFDTTSTAAPIPAGSTQRGASCFYLYLKRANIHYIKLFFQFSACGLFGHRIPLDADVGIRGS